MLSAVETSIYEQHASDASFLWMLRDAAARDAAYDLAGLAEVDERVEAHLDGLRLAGDPGFAICKAGLANAEGGEVFSASVLAIERHDLTSIAEILDVAGDTPELARGLVSALGWVAIEDVRAILPGLLHARCPPALHYVGIAACAVQREDPGNALGFALHASDARLRARALRAVGELGKLELLPDVRGALDDTDAACRYWASWSGSLLGETDAAEALFRLATQSTEGAERAFRTSVRRLDPRLAAQRLPGLSATASEKAAVAGAAALGDPAMIPWIIQCMAAPELARAAGAAFSLITGADLTRDKLRAAKPKGAPPEPNDDPADENVAEDTEESLGWPDAAAVQAYWSRRAREFPRGTRFLLGKPLSSTWLEHVLRTGTQPARAAAAEELFMSFARKPLFEVRAPAPKQRGALA